MQTEQRRSTDGCTGYSHSGVSVRKYYRLAIVASHPIEHFAPFFRRLAQHPALDVHVFYYSSQGLEPSYDEEFGVQYQWDIPLTDGYKHTFLPDWKGQLSAIRRRWALSPAVWPAITRGDFDGVLFYGWSLLNNWIGFIACLRHHVPILLIGDTTRERSRGPLLKFGRSTILKWLFHRVAAFMITSEKNAEFYGRYGALREQFFFLPLSPDQERFSRYSHLTPAERAEIRKGYGLPPDMKLIIFSGKFAPHKRPLDLLKAFTKLQNTRMANTGLVFVGDGSERRKIEDYIGTNNLRNVFLLGFRNQSEMPSIYGSCDVFVLPSESDQNPLVVLEAMACGLPCILSDAVGRYGENEPVRPNENGLIYTVGDVAKLASHLEKLLVDEATRSRMGEAGFRRVGRWSYETGVTGILNALEFIRGGPPAL